MDFQSSFSFEFNLLIFILILILIYANFSNVINTILGHFGHRDLDLVNYIYWFFCRTENIWILTMIKK